MQRTIAALALLMAAAACDASLSSLKARGGGAVGGTLGTSDTSKVAGGTSPVAAAVPQVQASKEDPVEVRNLAQELDVMEKALAQGDVQRYHTRHWSVWSSLGINPSPELQASPKFGALRQRFFALDLRLAQRAGGHASEIMGDGRRVAEASPDALEAVAAALDACQAAAKTSYTRSDSDIPKLNEAYQKYEKKLDRAKKVDPNVLRFAGKKPDGTYSDIPFELSACEAEVAARRMEFEDEPTTELGHGSTYKACGYDEYTLRALKIGHNKFGPFDLRGVPATNGYAFPCAKFPRSPRLPGEIKVVLHKVFPEIKPGDVVAMAGGFEFEQEGLRIYKDATIRIYSSQTELKKNDCDSKDTKVVCEASGSNTVRAYNELTHYLSRADLHRKAGRPDRCKELSKKAFKTAEQWTEFYDKAKKSGDWAQGLKYKTKQDGTLTETAIVARVQELGKKADERSTSAWCAAAGGE